MSLADLMRKGGLQRVATLTVATGATHEAKEVVAVAVVATVAVASATGCKAANDAVGLTVARIATVAVANLPDNKTAPAETIEAVPTTTPDPDRWCWPHSDALTGREIDTFTGRLALFTAKGLTPNDAEVLADKLMIRDRDGDDRRVCLECSHLRCQAGHSHCLGLRYAGMGGSLVLSGQIAMLQRCDGFNGAAA